MYKNKCSGCIPATKDSAGLPWVRYATTIVLLFVFFLCSLTEKSAAALSPAEIADMYNLLMNLDNIFLTTAAEVNGVPIMYNKDKWVQISMDVLPLIPVKYGSWTYPIPMWADINCRVDVVKEGDVLPEITVGGGFWSFLPMVLASSFSGGLVNASFSNWNVGTCISKTAGEKIRQHLAIQYSRFTGSIGGAMIDQITALNTGTSTFRPEMSNSRLDLSFGVDYTFIPNRTGFFLIGYDLLRGEIFEKIGIKFGGWVYKVGIYPGNIVAIAPSIEWTLMF